MTYIINQLQRYKVLKAEVKNLELDIEELHEVENLGPGAISYEERTGVTNKITSMTENQAIAIADKHAQLEKEKRAKIRDIERIENALSILGEKERQVLELKHINNARWDTVTYKLDRSYSQCKAIEADALKKIAPFFKNH